ncbi:MAG: hypothetical protein J6R22_03890 [Alphaproteobacteria bacterium]|nr:hypothetical protein [Alphaproteobacteria bacterium]
MANSFNKLFGKSMVALGALMVVCAAYAAGRDGSDIRTNAQSATGREGREVPHSSVGRMPTMPTLPINSVGNLSPNISPKPVIPYQPDQPDQPDVPDIPDEPDIPDVPVEPECPDGGVANSEYTVDMCMNDIYACVNGGALPNGINDLFNADMMSSVINGVGICINQVEKCVAEVRRDCKNVYNSNSEVWIDFESRKVQPEYYNFVLRKTGLTPYQAQVTCEMLDKVAYGPSFSAIDAGQNVTNEYAQNVGAFNEQMDGALEKIGELGNLEPGRVDEVRGHYARWDAVTAECLVRVAAYHKDELITNTWLFGGAGDDKPAEAWLPTGEVFKCNGDLFGFGLFNQTKTAAVLAPTAGAVVGGAIGAGVGSAKEGICDQKVVMDKLNELTKEQLGVVSVYYTKVLEQSDVKFNQGKITPEQCENIKTAYGAFVAWVNKTIDVKIEISGSMTVKLSSSESYQYKDLSDAMKLIVKALLAGGLVEINGNELDISKYVEEQRAIEALRFLADIFDDAGRKANIGKGAGIGAATGAGVGGLATGITAFVERNNITCRVGDGLQIVGFNKSDTISTLKEFYVKWGLNLPEAIKPNTIVTDCLSWQSACAGIADYSQCKAAQINYQPVDAPNVTQVRAACTVSGNTCIHNPPVAKSYGACE